MLQAALQQAARRARTFCNREPSESLLHAGWFSPCMTHGQFSTASTNNGVPPEDTSDASAAPGTTALPIGPHAAEERFALAAAAEVRGAGEVPLGNKELVMVFTCGQCNTRAAKAFSRSSFEKGVVIIDCPMCKSRHLIADHLGWFGEKGTVEDFVAHRGDVVLKKRMDGTTEITPEEMMGWPAKNEGHQL